MSEDRLSPDELERVDSFRLARKTSVLTVLFTDIEGFTRFTEERGDEASDRLRHEHDRLVAGALEEGGAGQVIKRIGDAVMAVFAEPSAAVERALLVQERLASWNDANPKEPLNVRIGLHMGQVTVEDAVSPDVFGRHVNRASRIEGLAAGGQVFCIYPVFDSAKSWLLARTGKAAWALHGRYAVKGIDEPVDVYELYDPGRRAPKAPDGGTRVRNLPKPLAAAGLVAAGVALALGLMRYTRTSVTFEDFNINTDVLADGGVKLVVEGEPGEHLRRLKTALAKGHHVLYYDVSNVTRYYAEVDVARGENVLRPRWTYFGLPGMEQNVGYDPKGPNEHSFTQSYDYETYGADGKSRKRKAEVTLRLAAKPVRKDLVSWLVSWKVDVDGKTVIDKTEEYVHSGKGDDSETHEAVGWQDDAHSWRQRSYVYPTSIQTAVDSSYLGYR